MTTKSGADGAPQSLSPEHNETNQSLNAKVEKSRVRQKSYSMDLRVHSPASLGYFGIDEIDTAPALVRLAKVKGLDVIAVTDFYSGTFLDRILDAARDTSLTVIPGVDIRCRIQNCDDVVISCLFPEHFGTRPVEEFLAELGVPRAALMDPKYIINRPFEEILAIIDARGGVALPSRMDKTPNRMAIIPTLVEKYGFRAFDLAYMDTSKFFKTRWPKVKFHLFSFSDASALAQVGSRIARVKMSNPGFEGIRAIVSRDQTAA